MTIKYPRTYHLPWSEGIRSDDKVIKSLDSFEGQWVVVTEKLDGENCTMTSEKLYARSTSSTGGVLRARALSMWASIQHIIPENWRICGENMQWEHSIRYDNLIAPFYGFSIWENDTCLEWDDTVEYLQYFKIPPVPVLYRGPFDIDQIRNLDMTGKEGYVVRVDEEFHHDDFSQNVAKWVRKGHVQTDTHWSKNLKENGFKSP